MGCYADSRLCPQTRPSTLLCQEEFCVLISILCSPFILSFNSNELYWHECNNKIAKASYIQHTSFSLSVVLSLSHLSHCIFFSWFMQAEIRRSKRAQSGCHIQDFLQSEHQPGPSASWQQKQETKNMFWETCLFLCRIS